MGKSLRKMSGSPARLPRQEREQQMLQAAASVFAQRGFHASSMDEIARQVGITKPMLYAYFGSKEGLYLATVDRAGQYLVSAVEQLLQEPDARRRLHLGASLLINFIDRDRHGWAVLFAEGMSGSAVAGHVAKYRSQIVRAAAVTLAGLARPPAGDGAPLADAYAVMLLGAGEALARWWLDRPALPVGAVSQLVAQLVDSTVETYLAACRAPARTRAAIKSVRARAA